MPGFFDRDNEARQRIRSLEKAVGATPGITPNDGAKLVAKIRTVARDPMARTSLTREELDGWADELEEVARWFTSRSSC
jgi:hypothetical protein